MRKPKPKKSEPQTINRLVLKDKEAITFPLEVLRVGVITEVNLSENRIESLPPEIATVPTP